MTTWIDQAGLYDATAVNSPSLETNLSDVFNFNPAIHFDGSTDHFLLDDVLGTGNTEYEIFSVSTTDRVDDGGVDHIIAF